VTQPPAVVGCMPGTPLDMGLLKSLEDPPNYPPGHPVVYSSKPGGTMHHDPAKPAKPDVMRVVRCRQCEEEEEARKPWNVLCSTLKSAFFVPVYPSSGATMEEYMERIRSFEHGGNGSTMKFVCPNPIFLVRILVGLMISLTWCLLVALGRVAVAAGPTIAAGVVAAIVSAAVTRYMPYVEVKWK
jgi:hypothetical protein